MLKIARHNNIYTRHPSSGVCFPQTTPSFNSFNNPLSHPSKGKCQEADAGERRPAEPDDVHGAGHHRRHHLPEEAGPREGHAAGALPGTDPRHAQGASPAEGGHRGGLQQADQRPGGEAGREDAGGGAHAE